MTRYYYFVAEWDEGDGILHRMCAIQSKEGVGYFALVEALEYVEKKYNLQHPSVIITNVVEITKEEADKYLEWI